MTTIAVPAAVPDEFLCPITRELMKDPVIAAGSALENADYSELPKGNNSVGTQNWALASPS